MFFSFKKRNLLFQAFDLNSSGSISAEEFQEFIFQRKPPTEENLLIDGRRGSHNNHNALSAALQIPGESTLERSIPRPKKSFEQKTEGDALNINVK